MICSHCGQETTTNPCAACGTAPLLDGRYRLDEVIGQGGSGVTYRATRLADGYAVCVKELAFHALKSFEAERLFRREAAVLRQLEHPGIPAYVDDFSAGEGRSLALYLVQELVDGQNLADELESHRYTEREVLDLLDELLQLLVYLHGLAPPVIHRDLKPSNVMRRRDDGQLVLIDFGSVKDTVAASVTGSATVAGTFGFMAPEQLYGTATEVSDLYAVGVIGVVLLSRRQPAELVDAEQHLAWREHVHATPGTLALLDRLTQRDATMRPRSAAAARALVAAARAGRDAPLVRAAAPPPPATRPAPRRQPMAEGSAPAPDRVGRGPLLVFAALVVAAGAFLTMIMIPGGASHEPNAVSCEGDACAPLSEIFLDGLHFGMSPDEARAGRRELAEASLHHVAPSDLTSLIGLYVDPDTLIPRDALSAKLLLEGEPASCTFEFTEAQGLGHIDCSVDLVDADAVQSYVMGLGSRLALRYGDWFERGQARVWTSGEGTLEVRSDELPPRVSVRQASAGWERAGRDAEEAAEARRRAEDERAKAAKKAALDTERARLEALRRDASP